jgi:hypothetical protein
MPSQATLSECGPSVLSSPAHAGGGASSDAPVFLQAFIQLTSGSGARIVKLLSRIPDGSSDIDLLSFPRVTLAPPTQPPPRSSLAVFSRRVSPGVRRAWIARRA